MNRLNLKNKGEEHNFWQNYTDLMAGLLIVFIITSLVVWYNYTLLATTVGSNDGDIKIR